MTAISIHQKVTKKIIALLRASSDVTNYVPSGQIYGSHIATLSDAVYPAISIHIGPGLGKSTSEAGIIRMNLQIDLWFGSRGKNAYVWDDVFTCYQAVLDALHRNGGYDASISARIIEITNVSEGPKMFEQEPGLMHWPARFKVAASPN